MEEARQETAAGAQQLAERQQQVEQQQARLTAQAEELKQRGEAVAAAQAESQARGEQLQQSQEELEQFFLAHQQATERNIELEGRLRQEEQLQAEMREALATAQAEGEARSEQLHQVQEELEHYFLHGRGQAELIEQLSVQQQRALQLLKMVWVFWKGSIIDV